MVASLSTLAAKEMEAAVDSAEAEARIVITALTPLVVATATVLANPNNRVELLEVSFQTLLVTPRSFTPNT